jgi:hypothetical protein
MTDKLCYAQMSSEANEPTASLVAVVPRKPMSAR